MNVAIGQDADFSAYHLGKDVSSYCSGLIDTGCSRIPSTAPANGTPSSSIIQDHVHLLEVSEQVVKEIIKIPVIQDVSAPMLLHAEFHKRNIFVSDDDPTRITAVIDWQSTGVDPVFTFANETPDMVADRTIDKPLFEDEPDASSGQYNTATHLGGMVQLRSVKNLSNFLSVGMNWGSRILALTSHVRRSLLGTQKSGKDFENSQSLKLFLIRAINSNTEGWVNPRSLGSSQRCKSISL